MQHWATIHEDYKILQKKREVPADESEKRLKKALGGLSIFESNQTSQHNSPQLINKTHIDELSILPNYNVGM